MKLGKTSRQVKITAETMKYMGNCGKNICTELLNDAIDENKIPEDGKVVFRSGEQADPF